MIYLFSQLWVALEAVHQLIYRPQLCRVAETFFGFTSLGSAGYHLSPCSIDTCALWTTGPRERGMKENRKMASCMCSTVTGYTGCYSFRLATTTLGVYVIACGIVCSKRKA